MRDASVHKINRPFWVAAAILSLQIAWDGTIPVINKLDWIMYKNCVSHFFPPLTASSGYNNHSKEMLSRCESFL